MAVRGVVFYTYAPLSDVRGNETGKLSFNGDATTVGDLTAQLVMEHGINAAVFSVHVSLDGGGRTPSHQAAMRRDYLPASYRLANYSRIVIDVRRRASAGGATAAGSPAAATASMLASGRAAVHAALSGFDDPLLAPTVHSTRLGVEGFNRHRLVVEIPSDAKLTSDVERALQRSRALASLRLPLNVLPATDDDEEEEDDDGAAASRPCVLCRQPRAGGRTAVIASARRCAIYHCESRACAECFLECCDRLAASGQKQVGMPTRCPVCGEEGLGVDRRKVGAARPAAFRGGVGGDVTATAINERKRRRQQVVASTDGRHNAISGKALYTLLTGYTVDDSDPACIMAMPEPHCEFLPPPSHRIPWS